MTGARNATLILKRDLQVVFAELLFSVTACSHHRLHKIAVVVATGGCGDPVNALVSETMECHQVYLMSLTLSKRALLALGVLVTTA